jgi:hypothetical protein
MPSMKEEQPGQTYYFSPLTVNNIGFVDHAHLRPDGEIGDHMHCHVYHEGVGKKKANNICSIIMKTLWKTGMLKKGETALKLTLVFDNCTGQNKNNTILG